MYNKFKEFGLPLTEEDQQYTEQSLALIAPESPKESEFLKKNYDPYEQDLYNFPDEFKVFGENFEKYEAAKKYFD